MRISRRKKTECPNCGSKLTDNMNFCYLCGQENHHHRVGVRTLIRDLLRENLSFDTKGVRSIVPLVIKPGHLTNEFIKGKRANYNRPLRLYLFISFVYFLLSGILPKTNDESVTVGTEDSLVPDIELDVPDVDILNDNINEEVDPHPLAFDSTDFSGESNLEERLRSLDDPEQRQALSDELTKNAPVVAFALIPVLGFWIFLLFYRKASYYVDSFVFALHGQTLLFIVLILNLLIDVFIVNPYIDGAILCCILGYFGIAAKNVYLFSWTSTIFRLLGVLLLHLLSAAIVLIIYVIVIFIFFT